MRFLTLLQIRSKLQEANDSKEFQSYMRNHGDVKSLDYVFIVDSQDSEIATNLDFLEKEVSSFFFDCSVQALSID